MSDTNHIHQHYPKWLYHSVHGSRIFASPNEVHAAGDGWSESPSAMIPPPPQARPGVVRTAVERARKRTAKKAR